MWPNKRCTRSPSPDATPVPVDPLCADAPPVPLESAPFAWSTCAPQTIAESASGDPLSRCPMSFVNFLNRS